MPTLNFYLDKADKQGNCFILLCYQGAGQKFRHSVKLKVKPSQWLAEKQRIRVRNKDDEFNNGIISNLESIINDAEKHSLLTHNEVNFSFVKQRFIDVLGKKDIKRSFMECYEEYVEYSKVTMKRKTTDRYITCKNHLTDFRQKKRYELTFERMNQAFYDSFTSFLIKDKGQLNNTVGNYIKTVKAFINFCIERDYCKPIKEVKKFKVCKEEAELIALTEEELLHLYHLELKSNKLMVVRDNFCFACFTGLRYSDISKLQPENIKADYIELKTEKTREFLKIPLNVYAKGILQRNSGRLPALYSNQKTNEYLKELGEFAGFDEMIQVIKYSGVEKKEFLEPKHNFISTHTARRTFVTLSLEKGMRPETVMSITGHKDYKTFKKYIKLTDKVKLMEMNNIWSASLHIA